MSVHKQAGLAAQAPPIATPASDCARLADKLVLHTAARARTELPAECLAARGSLADFSGSIAPIAVHSDRFPLRFAEGRRRASFSGSRRPPMCRIFLRRC